MYRILIVISFFFTIPLWCQADVDSDLFKTLKVQDSVFFERSFNLCDLEYLQESITDDLKFFHDQGGFQDRKTFLENIQQYICTNPEQKPIRKLVAGSLEVFPLHNNGVLYGAIQKGRHNFYIREAGKEDRWTSTARFTSVWLLDSGKWKLSVVLSYDHRDPETDH